MSCSWCEKPIEASRRDAKFCSRACRQCAYRLRRRRKIATAADRPLLFVYADPPYPGKAMRCYGMPEVDHEELVSRLEERRLAGELGGYAVSTGAFALVPPPPWLSLFPAWPTTRTCAWTKLGGAHPATYGIHNMWEPVIVVGGRQEPPGVRDWLSCLPARRGGELVGRKPLAFCAWLFDVLGMRAGDELEDVFPGTGMVGRAWRQVSREYSRAASDRQLSFTELADDTDGSPGQA